MISSQEIEAFAALLADDTFHDNDVSVDDDLLRVFDPEDKQAVLDRAAEIRSEIAAAARVFERFKTLKLRIVK